MIRLNLRRNKCKENSPILHHLELGLRTGSGHRKQRRGEFREIFGAELCHPHLYVEVLIPRTFIGAVFGYRDFIIIFLNFLIYFN